MFKMQLVLLITAILLVGAFVMPSYAQTVISTNNGTAAANLAQIPVSGSIAFDASNYNNITSASQLTIYARGPSGFDNKTNPAADGTFTMIVPSNGSYSFWVIPAKLDYLNTTTNATYSVLYPDGTTTGRIFTQNVTDQGLTGVVIPMTSVQTGIAMSVTPEPPAVTPAGSATAQATPGFTIVVALIALGAMAAVAYRKK